MQETNCCLKGQEEVQWLPEDQIILVSKVDLSWNYLLVTNSLSLSFSSKIQSRICPDCSSLHHFINYQANTKNGIQSDKTQSSIFKYCILILNKEGHLIRMLGTTKKEHFHLGNFVARPKTISSEKKKRQSEDLEEQELRIRKRKATSVYDLLADTNGDREGPGDDVELYVTKLQGEVRQFNQCNMFHQYAWNEQEVEFLMRKVKEFFGDYQKVVQKRKYIMFQFKRSVGDQLFWQKWSRTGGDILFKNQSIIEDKTINYYVLSKQPLLSREEQVTKLFQLPGNSQIIDFCLADPWVIIAGQNYLLFLHNYKSMELFQHIDKVSPTKLQLLGKEFVVLLNKNGSIHCYKMSHKKIHLIKTLTIPFVIPYCLAQIDKHVFIAGIDKDAKKEKSGFLTIRNIHRFPFSLSEEASSKQIKVQPNCQIHVVNLPKQKRKSYVSHLTLIDRSLLACSCLEVFYLFNLSSQKLSEVQMKAPIVNLLPIAFPFNIFNFTVVTDRGELIKIGIEACGSTLGSQLQRLRSSKVKGCSIDRQRRAKFDLFVLQGNQIYRLNYLKEERQHILRENQNQIVSLASDENGIGYLVNFDQFYELKYLQF